MNWHRSHRADPRALPLADRHYPRQKRGSRQFVAPGSPLVLLTAAADALWVSLKQKHQDHRWKGAWLCTLFRNESTHLSSALIREALAATRWAWGEPPPAGLLTFVNVAAIRHKRDPGRCFRRAGFVPCGFTQKRRRLALRLAPEHFPPPEPAMGEQFTLEAA